MNEGKSIEDLVEMEPFTEEDVRNALAHSMENLGLSELPYSPQETADLEDLGIDATRRTREAHSALQQIRWFEARENFEWVLDKSRDFVIEQQEIAKGIGAPLFSFQFDLECISVRSGCGRLTEPFIEWYSFLCEFDESSGYRQFSLEKIRRGDHCFKKDDEVEGSNTKVKTGFLVEGAGFSFPRLSQEDADFSIRKKMVISKCIESIGASRSAGICLATGRRVWDLMCECVEDNSHPLHQLMARSKGEIEFTEEGAVNGYFKVKETGVARCEDYKWKFEDIGNLCSPKKLRNDKPGGYMRYVAGVNKALGENSVW